MPKKPKGFTEYYIHDYDKSFRKWGRTRYYLSIDPGIKHFAFRIEKRTKNEITTEVMFIENFSTCKSNIYLRIREVLTSYDYLVQKCNFIIIEYQYGARTDMSRIMQHLLTYFMEITRNNDVLPSIIELGNKTKARYKDTKDKDVKAWAVGHAKKLLKERFDDEGLMILKHYVSLKIKIDDLSDTIVQIDAFLLFCEEFYPEMIK